MDIMVDSVSLIDDSNKFSTYVLRVCSGYLKITHDCVSGMNVCSFVARAYFLISAMLNFHII